MQVSKVLDKRMQGALAHQMDFVLFQPIFDIVTITVNIHICNVQHHSVSL